MNLSLIWDIDRQVYRAEVTRPADEWGSASGSWSESTDAKAAVMHALRMAGAIPEKLAKAEDAPSLGLTLDDFEPSPLSLRVAVGQAEILDLLEEGVTYGWAMEMTYTSVAGEESKRTIKPVSIEQRRVGLGFEEPYLRASDLDHPLGLVKTFKVAGIQRLELIA